MLSAAREFISVSGNMGDLRILHVYEEGVELSLLNVMTNSGALKSTGNITNQHITTGLDIFVYLFSRVFHVLVLLYVLYIFSMYPTN